MNQVAILGTGDAPLPNAPVPEPIAAVPSSYRPILRDVPGAVFPDTPEARVQCNASYLAAGLAAEQSGFAGVFINTVGDYGLSEVRQACRLPVTGAGEGAIRTAQRSGRFAIVSIWPPQLGFIYEAILAATRSETDCVAIHHLSQDKDLATLEKSDNFVSDMQACSASSLQAIRQACATALDQGADVIVLGCTCMHPVADILGSEGLPIIEPMAAGYRYLLSLLAEASTPGATSKT